MFDPYLIVPASLRNVERDGVVVGFQLQARCGYYRRLILSMVEDLTLTVDGAAYPRESVRFDLRGKSYGLDEMENEYTFAWEFGEPATLTVLTPGGLGDGEHTIALREQLRISYMPRPEVAEVEVKETMGGRL